MGVDATSFDSGEIREMGVSWHCNSADPSPGLRMSSLIEPGGRAW